MRIARITRYLLLGTAVALAGVGAGGEIVPVSRAQGEKHPTGLEAAADHTTRERIFVLNQVPSGYPLVDDGVTSEFGWRGHPVTGERAHHNGIDLRAAAGTPVHATADGVVEWAAVHDGSGMGVLVILRHNYGFRTFFGHLESVAVERGDFVDRGAVIGAVGSTGLSNGPHLHYEVRHIYRALDPKPFLEWNLDTYDTLFASDERIQWDALARAASRQLGDDEAPRLSLRDEDAREEQ